MAVHTTPSVSIIIPSFNAETTVFETIASVIEQTYSDWEIIVVDDGSSDRTTAIVLQCIEWDKRIRLLTQRNAGPSAARNRGVKSARGDFVAFLDSDDTWAPFHLEHALGLLNGDAELGVAFAPCAIVDKNGADTGQRTRPSTTNVTPADLLSGNPTATCSSLVVRKSVFSSAGLMRKDMVHAEDQEWLFRVLLSGWNCRSHSCCTVNYRCNPRGLSSDVQRMYDGWKMFIDLARRNAPGLVSRYLPRATASMHFYYVRRLIRDHNYSFETLRHFCSAWLAAPSTALQLSLRLLVSVTIPMSKQVFDDLGITLQISLQTITHAFNAERYEKGQRSPFVS